MWVGLRRKENKARRWAQGQRGRRVGKELQEREVQSVA